MERKLEDFVMKRASKGKQRSGRDGWEDMNGGENVALSEYFNFPKVTAPENSENEMNENSKDKF